MQTIIDCIRFYAILVALKNKNKLNALYIDVDVGPCIGRMQYYILYYMREAQRKK